MKLIKTDYIKALANKNFAGLKNGQIADANGYNAGVKLYNLLLTDLANMQKAGKNVDSKRSRASVVFSKTELSLIGKIDWVAIFGGVGFIDGDMIGKAHNHLYYCGFGKVVNKRAIFTKLANGGLADMLKGAKMSR